MRWRPLGAIAAVVVAACPLTGCGTPTLSSTPRACALLGDTDIEHATGSAPATSGGGDANGQSTCSWALGGDNGGSVTITLLDCTAATCDGTFASAAPAASYSTTTGIGDEERTSASGGQRTLVIRTSREVMTIAVDLGGADPGKALQSLAATAVSRLP